MRISPAVIRSSVSLPLFMWKIPAGFPSPAADYLDGSLDLNELLIKHPSSTYFMRMTGDSMIGAGMFDNDILVIDKAVAPQHRKVVIAMIDAEYTVKRFIRQQGSVELRSENPAYPAMTFQPGSSLTIWGVVLHSVRMSL